MEGATCYSIQQTCQWLDSKDETFHLIQKPQTQVNSKALEVIKKKKRGWEGPIKPRITCLHFTGHWSMAMAGLGSGDASFFKRSQKSRLLMGSFLKLQCWPLQHILIPCRQTRHVERSALVCKLPKFLGFLYR